MIMIADEMHGRGYYNVIMMYYRWRRSMEYAASVPRLTDGASAWQAVLLLPRGLHRSDRDDDRRPIWCMAANSTLRRVEVFMLHRRALLGSGSRLRRVSGEPQHVDLDRAWHRRRGH